MSHCGKRPAERHAGSNALSPPRRCAPRSQRWQRISDDNSTHFFVAMRPDLFRDGDLSCAALPPYCPARPLLWALALGFFFRHSFLACHRILACAGSASPVTFIFVLLFCYYNIRAKRDRNHASGCHRSALWHAYDARTRTPWLRHPESRHSVQSNRIRPSARHRPEEGSRRR